jgi:hypothetical protein
MVYAIGGEEGSTLSDEVLAATSTDGGASFAPSVQVSNLASAAVPAVRAPSLPSADVAADGRLFVAWQDCRLDPACQHDRILLSTSPDGQTWSTPVAVAPGGPNVTQFVPGLGVDPMTSRAARVAIVYYTLTECTSTDCPRIDSWLVRSSTGGRTWRKPQRLNAEPMQLEWLPRAGGRFLGDYLSTSFVNGRAVPVYSLAVAPWGGKLRDAIMALQTG